MKKIASFIALILFCILCFSYPPPKPFPPFHIVGNLYYVGTDDLASYLIVTSKGNILINSNFEADVPMIKTSIEKLGFSYHDTKILLISHAHHDHSAGSKLINNETYPRIAKDYEHSIKVLKSMRADIFLGAHAVYFDLEKKYALLKTSTRNPFIDPAGYQNHVKQKEQEFYNELEKQKLVS